MPLIRSSQQRPPAPEPEDDLQMVVDPKSIELRANIPRELRQQFRLTAGLLGLSSTDAVKIAVTLFLARFTPMTEILLSQKMEQTGRSQEEIISTIIRDFEHLSSRKRKNFLAREE